MRSVLLKNVTKLYNGDVILENINLTIPAGKIFVLLGPSGCGKTTLLRLIGGFEIVDKGTIFLGDENITDKPINQRHINTVFQNYALFPHLTVFDNIAYGPRAKGSAEDEVKQRVHKMLQSFHLEQHKYKHITQLSGGQQQRVALARAIINEPDVLLLDEPLAALDLKLREKMLMELIELQDKLKMTFIYVTHDQFEALTLADQMAIMNSNGELEQIGTPKEIYEFPVSSFVARFVGTTNIFEGVLLVDAGETFMQLASGDRVRILLPQRLQTTSEGSALLLSVRPEKIYITKQPTHGFSAMLKGSVYSIVYHGRSTQYNVRLKSGMTVAVFEQNEEHFPQEVFDYDNEVYLYWQKENAVVLER